MCSLINHYRLIGPSPLRRRRQRRRRSSPPPLPASPPSPPSESNNDDDAWLAKIVDDIWLIWQNPKFHLQTQSPKKHDKVPQLKLDRETLKEYSQEQERKDARQRWLEDWAEFDTPFLLRALDGIIESIQKENKFDFSDIVPNWDQLEQQKGKAAVRRKIIYLNGLLRDLKNTQVNKLRLDERRRLANQVTQAEVKRLYEKQIEKEKMRYDKERRKHLLAVKKLRRRGALMTMEEKEEKKG